MTFGGGTYSLKLPASYNFVPVKDRHPERADVAQRFYTFLTKENIFATNHDGRPKTIPNLSHPNITYNNDPITLPHFSIKPFDYLLRCLLHGTAKRHNYTQPLDINGAKGGCTRLHPQGLLPIFDSPPDLGNLRSTLLITQNGQLTLTNNHGRKTLPHFRLPSSQPYGVNGARWGNAPVFILGVYCPFSGLGSPTLGNLTFTLPITQKN
jgi:hypothetical protein